MKKAQLPTCEVSELGFFKVCEMAKITSGVQALIDLQLCITCVMLTPFGIGLKIVIFCLFRTCLVKRAPFLDIRVN